MLYKYHNAEITKNFGKHPINMSMQEREGDKKGDNNGYSCAVSNPLSVPIQTLRGGVFAVRHY